MTTNNDPFSVPNSPFGQKPERKNVLPPAVKQGNIPLPSLPNPTPQQPKTSLPTLPSLPKPVTVSTAPNIPSIPGLPTLLTNNVGETQTEETSGPVGIGDTYDPDYDILSATFFDELAPRENFREISEEEDNILENIKIAYSEDTETQTLYALSTNEDSRVRENLAANPSTPTNILTLLKNDEDSFVRQAVMDNPNTPEKVYASFVNDEEILIIWEFIDAERTTPNMLTPIHNTTDYAIVDKLLESSKVSDFVKANIRTRLGL